VVGGVDHLGRHPATTKGTVGDEGVVLRRVDSRPGPARGWVVDLDDELVDDDLLRSRRCDRGSRGGRRRRLTC